VSGETKLSTLLQELRPRLSPIEFAFGVVREGEQLPPHVQPVSTVREDEGLTVVAPADQLVGTRIDHIPGWAMISLEVHSSLSAIGLMAAVAQALAAESISVNAVAGFHHDHIFVQWDRRGDALQALSRLSQTAALGG